MRSILLLSAILCCASSKVEVNHKTLTRLDKICCLVKTAERYGSGVIITRGDTHYVLSAGHIVDKQKDYEALHIVQRDWDESGEIAIHRYVADVIRHSPYDGGEDLLLLRLRSKNITKESTTFYCGTPKLGESLCSVASPGGDQYINTFSFGKFSSVGRVINGKVFDQISLPADAGSSGGGVFNTKGDYVGMMLAVRNCQACQTFIRPSRLIQKWANRVGVEFLFDTKLAVPSDDVLRSRPINELTTIIPFMHFPR